MLISLYHVSIFVYGAHAHTYASDIKNSGRQRLTEEGEIRTRSWCFLTRREYPPTMMVSFKVVTVLHDFALIGFINEDECTFSLVEMDESGTMSGKVLKQGKKIYVTLLQPGMQPVAWSGIFKKKED